jgi:hypothetical protein
MKYFVTFKNSNYSVSKVLANALTKSNFNFPSSLQDETTVFVLDGFNISFFQLVPTTSLSHFYILLSGKKCRITRVFYSSLLHSQRDSSNAVKKRKNSSFDKFYTKPSVARLCVSSFISEIAVKKQDLIIEPSAGNGSFIHPLEKIKCTKVLLDNAPENNQIIQVDFLK